MKIIILFVIYFVNIVASVKIIGIGNRCLDVKNGQKSNGTQIQIYDCNGNASQNFNFDIADNTLRAYQFTKCLDVLSPNNGALVQLSDCTLKISEAWDLNGLGEIVNRASGKCLDVREPANQNGAVLQIWTCTGSPNQEWRKA